MITLGTLDNFDYTNLILPVIKSFPSTAPEIWFDFFPNSVALVANFVIKDGLVAKICIIFKRTYKQKAAQGIGSCRPMRHGRNRSRNNC